MDFMSDDKPHPPKLTLVWSAGSVNVNPPAPESQDPYANLSVRSRIMIARQVAPENRDLALKMIMDSMPSMNEPDPDTQQYMADILFIAQEWGADSQHAFTAAYALNYAAYAAIGKTYDLDVQRNLILLRDGAAELALSHVESTKDEHNKYRDMEFASRVCFEITYIRSCSATDLERTKRILSEIRQQKDGSLPVIPLDVPPP